MSNLLNQYKNEAKRLRVKTFAIAILKKLKNNHFDKVLKMILHFGGTNISFTY